VPVVLARLGIGGDAARVVVTHHHDEAGTHDRQECHELTTPARALLILCPDPAERALDVTGAGIAASRLGLGERAAPGRQGFTAGRRTARRLGPRRSPRRGLTVTPRFGPRRRLRRNLRVRRRLGPRARIVPWYRVGHGLLPRRESGGSAASR